MKTRSTAGTLTVLVVLLGTATGCGDDDAQPTGATDSSASTSDASSEPMSPTETPTTESQDSSAAGSGGSMPVGDAVEPGQAVIVSTSNVEGKTSPLASALVDDRAVDAFLAGADLRLAADVRAAVEDVQVPSGSTLFGAVVAVGCETPDAVSWEKTFDGIEVSAPMPKSTVQCLVPVTSVALFLVEDSA